MEEEDDEDEGWGEVPMTSPGEEEKDEDGGEVPMTSPGEEQDEEEEEGRESGESAGISPVHASSSLFAAALSFCCDATAASLSFADAA